MRTHLKLRVKQGWATVLLKALGAFHSVCGVNLKKKRKFSVSEVSFTYIFYMNTSLKYSMWDDVPVFLEYNLKWYLSLTKFFFSFNPRTQKFHVVATCSICVGLQKNLRASIFFSLTKERRYQFKRSCKIVTLIKLSTINDFYLKWSKYWVSPMWN